MALLTFYELFAGGGMARLGLGEGWRCLFANDICPKKGRAYVENFGADDFRLRDVAEITAHDLPEIADLLWASSPCQDFSLAGNRAGAAGSRSGTITHVLRLTEELLSDKRPPKVVVIENVAGLLTANGGEDLNSIISEFNRLGYTAHIYRINADLFLPQSRDRIFIIAARGKSVQFPKLPDVPLRNTRLKDILEDNVKWNDPDLTDKIISEMSQANRDKVIAAEIGEAGAYYRRTRNKVPVYEIRFDGLAGCLRTASGGSSVQNIMLKVSGGIMTRRMTAREAARLMGLPDTYKLPTRFTEAYSLCGDGVAVPVVSYLAENVIEALIRQLEAHLGG